MGNDPNAGKYSRKFATEFKIAELVLRPYDGVLEWSKNDYEAFRFTMPDVTLLFYPHKNSNSNVSLRVRGQGSKNKQLEQELIWRMHIGNGHWVSFISKGIDVCNAPVFARKNGLEYGWARAQIVANSKKKGEP